MKLFVHPGRLDRKRSHGLLVCGCVWPNSGRPARSYGGGEGGKAFGRATLNAGFRYPLMTCQRPNESDLSRPSGQHWPRPLDDEFPRERRAPVGCNQQERAAVGRLRSLSTRVASCSALIKPPFARSMIFATTWVITASSVSPFASRSSDTLSKAARSASIRSESIGCGLRKGMMVCPQHSERQRLNVAAAERQCQSRTFLRLFVPARAWRVRNLRSVTSGSARCAPLQHDAPGIGHVRIPPLRHIRARREPFGSTKVGRCSKHWRKT
jgi:hypothetical protein